MELRQLTYFITISDAQSFTRAAEKLFVSQPALTGQINSLEAELGMKLFDRTNKSVRLTPAGEVFYKHATQVLSEVDNTLLHVQKIRRSEQSTIAFAVHPLFEGDIFFALHGVLRKHFPEQRIIFDIADWSNVETNQDRRRHSFGIVPGILGQTRGGQLLARSPFVFAALNWSAFEAEESLYLLPRGARPNEALTELLPDDVQFSTVASFENVIKYMEAAGAVALLPRAAVPEGAVSREINEAPRMSVLLTGPDERIKKELAPVLTQALVRLGWEREDI